MGSIRVKGEIVVTRDSGEDAPIPFDFTRTFTAIDDKVFTIGTNATRTLWDTTGAETAVDEFDFMLMLASGTLDVETTASSSSDLGSFRLVKDLPTMLGADDTSGALAIAGANLETFVKLRADEPLGSATVSLRMIVAKI